MSLRNKCYRSDTFLDSAEEIRVFKKTQML